MTTDGARHAAPTITSTEHTMTRLSIHTGIAFARFCSDFEQAAPAFEQAPFQGIVDAGGSWDEVRQTMTRLAPHELLVYARIDAMPLMGLAGHRVRAVEYLLGNHVIAETMFRRDPRALLYAPLRVLVFSDAAGDAVFAIDRPSTVFAGLGDTSIADVGVSLDHKVANLLRALGVDVGDALAEPVS